MFRSKPKMLSESKVDWLHLATSLLDLSIKMGSGFSFFSMKDPRRRIFIGYSPMHITVWLSELGLEDSIDLSVFLTVSRSGLPLRFVLITLFHDKL